MLGSREGELAPVGIERSEGGGDAVFTGDECMSVGLLGVSGRLLALLKMLGEDSASVDDVIADDGEEGDGEPKIACCWR